MSEAPKLKPLSPSADSFQPAQHAFITYQAKTAVGVSLDDIINSPSFFAHVARQLRIGSQIRCVSLDGTWIAELYVKYVMGSDVRVAVISATSLEEGLEIPDEDLSAGYKVQLCGPKLFCIINVETGEHVRQDIPTQAEAQKELAQYLNALSR